MPIPTTTSIKADPTEADVGEKISFAGLVRTVDGEPVQNASVYFETAINRKIWTLLARVRTDRHGAYSANVVFPKRGRFFVRAKFPGA